MEYSDKYHTKEEHSALPKWKKVLCIVGHILTFGLDLLFRRK